MKKRILSIMLTLCMMFMLVPTTVFAETPSDGNFDYSVSDTNEVTITGYTGRPDAVIIPDKISGKTVTAIGDYAFNKCKTLTSIAIPDSVTSIGNNAFFQCTNLTSIAIPDSVTSIGNNAFNLCINLTSIVIPNRVISIGAYAFNNCTSLESIQVDASNTVYSSVDGVLFNKDKTQLIKYPEGKSAASYSIPDSVTSIEKLAIINCTSLKSITIPASVKTIGNSAFFNCSNLTSVTFKADSQLTTIGQQAFQNCSNLTSVTFGGNSQLTTIGYKVFYDCTSLTSIDIPSSVTTIEERAFLNCSNLTSVTFEVDSQLTSIGDYAFYDCTSLESIDIPDSVTSIGANAFRNCSKLESIFLPEGLDVTSAGIPGTASQIKYSLDPTTKQITITKITLGEVETNVAIPDKICGYPVVAVVASEQSKVGAHTCKGGTATCTQKAECRICGQEYGELDLDNHDLGHVDAKEATAAETGNIEYWYCDDCQKYFLDDEGINEITLENTVISKLAPEIIEGKGQSITVGDKKALSFTSNAAYSDFDHVELDGQTLDEKNYTVKEGSIIVTFNADFVATLSVGEHTIGIVSTGGIATTTLTVNAKVTVDDSQSTQTGDNSQIVLWIALLFVSGGILIFNKKKKYNRS